MFAKNWVVFSQAEFIRGVHGVFLGVVSTNARFLRDEANEFAFGIILFCHNCSLF